MEGHEPGHEPAGEKEKFKKDKVKACGIDTDKAPPKGNRRRASGSLLGSNVRVTGC
jgi:hypothetical protein